jgi:hypothetical protein
MIYESAVTQFTLTFSDSAGALCAYKFRRHQWKQFHWRFLSQQRLTFHWLFFSQRGLWKLENPCVACGNSFVDDFWLGRDSVFLDYFWLNRGYVRWWIHASHVEAVSLTISETAATQLSLIISEVDRGGVRLRIHVSPVEAVSLSISESTGALRADESRPHLSKTFRWWF